MVPRNSNIGFRLLNKYAFSVQKNSGKTEKL